MKKKDKDLQPVTVEELITALVAMVAKGTVKKTDRVILSADEEGNSFSEVTMAGIDAGVTPVDDDKSCVVLYPIFQREFEECLNKCLDEKGEE